MPACESLEISVRICEREEVADLICGDERAGVSLRKLGDATGGVS